VRHFKSVDLFNHASGQKPADHGLQVYDCAQRYLSEIIPASTVIAALSLEFLLLEIGLFIFLSFVAATSPH
jgi:hypothetical protein